MPFFYFDTRNDENIVEDDGFELPGVEEAKVEAVGYLAEAARAHFGAGQRQELTCTVKDANKKALWRLRLILEIARS